MAIIEDKTGEVTTYLQQRLVGYPVNRGLTTFDEDTTPVPFGGRVGTEDKARGSAEITSLDLASGAFQRFDAQVPGVSILWIGDIIFTIRYKANSHGERWTVPLGAVVDNIWGSVDSAGTIKANLKIQPQTNGVLILEILVDPDADDRPGNFVKDYIAPLFRDAIDNTLEQFTNIQIN
jgi:hypothetical protein